MTRRSRHSAHRRGLRELLLTVGALSGTICILATLAALALGVKPLVFRSGSMSPEITTGALALAQRTPASDLNRGDVVSVVNPQGTRITHRIIDITRHDEQASVTLKGDANQVADAAPYVVDAADRVFFRVNGLGYVVTWLSSPAAVFAGGVLSGVLLMISFGRPRDRARTEPSGPAPSDHLGDTAATSLSGPTGQDTRGTHRGRTTGLATATAIAVLLPLGTGSADSTLAAFTDNAQATSGTFATATVTASPVSCASGPGSSVDLEWMHTNGAYAYVITADGTEAFTPIYVAGGTENTPVTQNVPIDVDLLSGLLGSNITLRVTTYISTWTASNPVPVRLPGLLGDVTC